MFEALEILASVKRTIEQESADNPVSKNVQKILAHEVMYQTELKRRAKNKTAIIDYLPTLRKFAELALKTLTENKNFTPPSLQTHTWFRHVQKNECTWKWVKSQEGGESMSQTSLKYSGWTAADSIRSKNENGTKKR